FARECYGVVPGAKKRAQLVEAIRNAFFGMHPQPRIKIGRPPADHLESTSVFFDDGKDDEEQ
ncbi:MAG: hypothetical protein IKC47_02390, partial [Clostridia bacterium]|nr:hypothetical protein [Clostridia bacterium]